MLNTSDDKKTRRDAGTVRLSNRDLVILRWIGEQYTICLDDLRRYLAAYGREIPSEERLLSPSATRHAYLRWQQIEFIHTPQKLLLERPAYFWLTQMGLNHLGLPYYDEPPLITELLHYDAVNRIRMHLQQTYTSYFWLSERAMVYQLPESNREYMRQVPRMPDAEVIIEGQFIAVKVLEKMPDDLPTLVADLSAQYREVRYYVHASLVQPLQFALSLQPLEKQKHITVYHLERPSEICH